MNKSVLTMPWISEMYASPDGGKLYQSSLIMHWSDLDDVKPDLIIDLAGIEADVPWNIRDYVYIHWPIEDGPVPKDLRTLHDLATLAVRFMTEGRRVLICCAAGVNRSSLMTGYILFLLNVRKSDALVDYIRQQRPGTLTNRSFENFVAGLPDSYDLPLHYRVLGAL